MAMANLPDPAAWIPAALDALRAEDAHRRARYAPAGAGRVAAKEGERVDFCSNDYLGLARDSRVLAGARRAVEAHGAGATAARLVSGDVPLFRELERRLAERKGAEDALLFSSGYLASLGAVSAVCGRGDRVYADRLAHACLLDGARLSGAELRRWRHNDPDHLRECLRRDADAPGRKLIVTESVFSMDGDLAPLPEIAALAAEFGALLLVDEAHATGVFGPGGAGRVAELGRPGAVHLQVGTLSKALGSGGGFVAGSAALIDWLRNRARSFLFTTAPVPAAAGAALAALDVLQAEPERPARLRALANRLRESLAEDGWTCGNSRSPILPLHAGSNAEALRLAAGLDAMGIGAVAIRPPTVPEGQARVRLTVNLSQTEADHALLREALRGLRA
jgi:8-amino-7-oxononanoate synthase